MTSRDETIEAIAERIYDIERAAHSLGRHWKPWAELVMRQMWLDSAAAIYDLHVAPLERERDAHYDKKMDAIRRLNDLRVALERERDATANVVAEARRWKEAWVGRPPGFDSRLYDAVVALDSKKEGGE